MYKSYLRNAKKRTSRNEKGREFIEPDDDQQYAVVRDMLGNGRVRAMVADGSEVVARIRGSMRKYKSKVLIASGDLIILSMRTYEADKADVIHKVNHDETTDLIYRGLLPQKIERALTESEMGFAASTDDYVIFTSNAKEGVASNEVASSSALRGVDNGEESDVDMDAI